jgi:hypothetical protein
MTWVIGVPDGNITVRAAKFFAWAIALISGFNMPISVACEV